MENAINEARKRVYDLWDNLDDAIAALRVDAEVMRDEHLSALASVQSDCQAELSEARAELARLREEIKRLRGAQ